MPSRFIEIFKKIIVILFLFIFILGITKFILFQRIAYFGNFEPNYSGINIGDFKRTDSVLKTTDWVSEKKTIENLIDENKNQIVSYESVNNHFLFYKSKFGKAKVTLNKISKVEEDKINSPEINVSIPFPEGPINGITIQRNLINFFSNSSALTIVTCCESEIKKDFKPDFIMLENFDGNLYFLDESLTSTVTFLCRRAKFQNKLYVLIEKNSSEFLITFINEKK